MDGSGSSGGRTTVATGCPWKGLSAYEAADAQLFYGRERSLRSLLAVMGSSTLGGVVGASGSGKSSLVLAGLAASGVVPVPLRPGAHPAERLSGTLPALSGPDNVLVVDQLEEVFTNCEDEDERASFLTHLYKLAEDGRARVVVALRSDHYGSCAPYARLADALSRAHVLLGAPTEEELRRIVTAPAEAARLTLERGLEDEIIDDVLGEPGALPLLSHALAQTWQRRQATTLTRAAYREVGGVRGAIARTAETAWAALPDGQQRAARAILTRIAMPSATVESGRRTAIADLVSPGDQDGEAALQALVNARLVTVDSGTAEIAHEAVFRAWPRLREWLDEDKDTLRLLGQLRQNAQLWHEHAEDRSLLLRGSRLEVVRQAAAERQTPLDRQSERFLDASEQGAQADVAAAAAQIQTEQRRNRRLRALVTSTAVLLAVAVGAGVFAMAKQAQAARARKTADARRLAAVATGVRSDQLDLAALLSLESQRRHDDPETRGALFAALTDQPGLTAYIPLVDSIIDIAIDPTGRIAAHPGQVEDIELWDVSEPTPTHLGTLDLGEAVYPYRIRFLQNGHLLVGDDNGRVRIFDPTRRRTLVEARDHDESGIWGLSLSPDGRVIASGGEDTIIRLTDARTGLPVREPLAGHEDIIQFVEFRPDGAVLASGGDDNTLRFWDATTWSPIGQPIQFDAGVWDIDWSPDGKTYVVSIDFAIQHFDAVTHQPLTGRIAAHDGIVYRTEFMEGGKLLVTAGEDGYVRFWDTASHQPSPRPAVRGHSSGARMAIAERANRMVTSGDDGRVAIWDLRGASGIAIPIREKTTGWTEVVATPSGRVFSGDEDGRVREWESNGKARGPARTLSDVPITALGVSDDAKRVAISRRDGKAQVFDFTNGRPVTPLLELGRNSTGVAISPNGQHLVTVQTDTRCETCVYTYNLAATPLRRVELRPPGLKEGQRSPANTAAFDATGTRFATGIRRGWVDVWETGTNRHLWGVKLERGVRSLAFSPDGTLLAAGANTGLLVVFDARDGKRLQLLKGHRGEVGGVAFSPDGTLLASASSQDHSLRVWRLDRGLTFGRPAWLGINDMLSLAWTGDGTRIAAPHLLTGVMFYDIHPRSMQRAACALSRRNLTQDEWRQYFPAGSRYHKSCDAFPAGP